MSQPLRVAIVSTYPPGKGTLNEYGFYLVQHFRRNPDVKEVILIADKLPAGQHYTFDDEGCPIRVEAVWQFNNWSNPVNILQAVRRTKPDVVLFNIQFLFFGDQKIPAALGLQTPFLVKKAGYPSVVLLHNILEEVDLGAAGITKNPVLSAAYQFIGSMLTRFILSADLVTVTIAKYVQVLEKKYNAKNVALVPHGSFELPPMPDFALPPGPMQVMTFGKFGTYKRVEAMIEAVELVRSRTTLDMEIVIAGTDSPNKAGYLDEMKQKYAHVPQLRFTGYVAEEDVPRIFGESAVVVFPYTSTTGSSGVLHQAGSYGRAAILPNIGDLGQLVKEEGYDGAFFEPDNVESLADAIQRVLEDDTYRRELATNNYFASVTLPMADIVDWYYLHFVRLLNERKARR
ncbi:glycosyl transferase, group 1 [Fibrisoma limi BUZ 3]|uniref:Glycosyl transferase, group 1 n=1 Tax=Fibrisoma limi BUZ 3 TaxID=1185876 RepID=I2GML9_9BACT|nr:glycosyltransferase [Fibrisoma limi]CCH55147.1 glycosyl transferase, group 1 [Fibrisoma limi BUZ 3]